ncbi:hypothetical protein Bbelb_334810 [Branchiostoma belcheri]|nr:hypothetical protein Bbelb_334810 [Branchiostoma belcheri]
MLEISHSDLDCPNLSMRWTQDGFRVVHTQKLHSRRIFTEFYTSKLHWKIFLVSRVLVANRASQLNTKKLDNNCQLLGKKPPSYRTVRPRVCWRFLRKTYGKDERLRRLEPGVLRTGVRSAGNGHTYGTYHYHHRGGLMEIVSKATSQDPPIHAPCTCNPPMLCPT